MGSERRWFPAGARAWTICLLATAASPMAVPAQRQARETKAQAKDHVAANPFSFPRLVQPVLERHCVGCHPKEPGAIDLRTGDWKGRPGYRYTSYVNLRPYAFFFGRTQGKYDPWTDSRTTPGEFGARASTLYQRLQESPCGKGLPPVALHRIGLWLDCNSDFFGAYKHTKAQARGELVRPTLK